MIKYFYLLVKPYWLARGAGLAWLLLFGTIGTTLGIVWVSVQYTNWSRAFYDAMSDFFAQASVMELAIQYAGLTAFLVLLVVCGNWLKKHLIIHWRQRMTLHYQADWLRQQTHYRMRNVDALDNPDQRIAEDVRLLIEQSLTLFLSLLKNVSSLFSFIVILWQISGELKFLLWGHPFIIHGYLVWVALIYSAISSVIAHRIGRPLHDLNVDKQRFEADYRASLLQVRENSEQIAFYRGERAELRRMNEFFSSIVRNWRSLMVREFKLDSFITSYVRLSLMLPLFAVLPMYIARQMSLGAVMQARGAFGYVQDAFGWFIDYYRQLVVWSATVERLWQFHQYVETTPPRMNRPRSGRIFHCEDYSPCDAEGHPMVVPISQQLAPGDWMMITGASGLGKTSLLRGLAGLQKRIQGNWQLPLGKRLFISQRTYLPWERLDSLLMYPDLAAVAPERLVHALTCTGLVHLIPELGERKFWDAILSGGEQQRLILARALVYQPVFLCMDEATSQLDESTASTLLEMLKRELPEMIVIAVSHQYGLASHFKYHWNVLPNAQAST
ncbi:ABC transporter ATP-binding protein/permease [Pectobacterium actinidiae]|uniref:ABC transporter ATP-binding protein/permease n=1 Tax=Pectobacterium actinidiae TaxID=1507808 RepID=UPI00382A4E9B